MKNGKAPTREQKKMDNRWKPCGGCRDVSKRNEMEHNIPPSA